MVQTQWCRELPVPRGRWAVVIGLVILGWGASAAGVQAQQRRPWSPGGSSAVGPSGSAAASGSSSPNRIRPSFPSPSPSLPPSGGGHSGRPDQHHHHDHHDHHHHGFFYPYYPYPVPYGVYCPSCGRRDCYDPYCSGPLYYNLPPRVTVVSPWGNYSYGGYTAPRTWQPNRFLAPRVNLDAAAAAIAPPAVGAQPGAAAGDDRAREEILRRVAALRPSTAQGRQQADRLVAEGDRAFADQNYRRAASKYRDAIAEAPDYPEPHLRAGHAYIATGDLELALTYFLIGYQLAGSIERPGFSLPDLYRGDRLAKEQHLNVLSDAALRQPDDGGLPFLTGVSLHYDGDPLGARPFFERAAQLAGPQQHYAAMFLPVVAVADAEPAAG